MKSGYLSQYFDAVAAKRLSAVEADLVRSNQHEFNGDAALKALFGTPLRQQFPARFIYLDDSDTEPVTGDGFLTWYDARAKSAERTGRSEFRMYFSTTPASQCAAEGDLLIFGKRPDGSVLTVIAEGDTTVERQLLWLFGIRDMNRRGYELRDQLETEQYRVGFAARAILDEIGITPEDLDENFLEAMLDRFGRAFPPTKIFSDFARDTLPDVTVQDDPDMALMAWLDREEMLFRTLERELVAERLNSGFAGDVDGFISYSLSIQNRRKSRAGAALENHLEFLFGGRRILFNRGVYTEKKSKPDFLFPGLDHYRNPEFPQEKLTVLASKSSCKDRWRQVLTEANRIPTKHLLTLEAGISESQTNEMQEHNVQLVVPKSISGSYTETQQQWLINLQGFLEIINRRQLLLNEK